LVTDVRLPRTSWKTVPQPMAGSRETSVPKVAVGPSDNTSPWVGRTQLTSKKLNLSTATITNWQANLLQIIKWTQYYKNAIVFFFLRVVWLGGTCSFFVGYSSSSF